MSGKRAKKLRKEIRARGGSLKEKRRYAGAEGRRGLLTFKAIGLRAIYQKAKKELHERSRSQKR